MMIKIKMMTMKLHLKQGTNKSDNKPIDLSHVFAKWTLSLFQTKQLRCRKDQTL